MSHVSIVRMWGKHDALQINIEIDDDFPGGIEETMATALHAYWEALTDTLGVETSLTDTDEQ